MGRILLPILLTAAAATAHAQSPARPAKAGPAAQSPAAVPVIGCPSLANYRMLRRDTVDEAAAAARLADPKADHLGCAAFAQDRITALADHVALGGAAYDCLALRGTTVCQWTAAGAVRPSDAAPAKPAPAEKSRR